MGSAASSFKSIDIWQQLDDLTKERKDIRLKGDMKTLRLLEKAIKEDNAAKFSAFCKRHDLNPSSSPYGCYWDDMDFQCYAGYCHDMKCTLSAWLKAKKAKACALYFINEKVRH